MGDSSLCGTTSSLCGTTVLGRENTEPMFSISASFGDDNTVDELSTGLSDKLEINDRNQTNTTDDLRRISVEGYYIEEEEEEEDEVDFSEEELLAQMGYGKSEAKRGYEEDEEEEDLSEESLLAQMGYLKNEPPKHEPITTPIADLNLVSALKGSREKEGRPAKECRVSWAPNVYDPPCTSDDHFASSKTERHKGEQKATGESGKNRQKGGGKGAGAIEGGGGGGKGGKAGGSKGCAGGGKAAGKNKEKKHADKKTKKHGGIANKYSGHGEEY